MTPIGNRPFDPTDYAFTVAEAAKVSQVAEVDIRNWMRRDVVPLGTKNRLGRIMFNALDIVHLRVIGDLITLLSVDPSVANPIGAHVADHCLRWLRKDGENITETPDGFRKETRLILHVNTETGLPELSAVDWGETVIGFTVPERGSGADWARRPMVMLPIEQIFGDVLEELFQILEQDENV